MQLLILIKPLGKRLCESLGVKYETGGDVEQGDDDYPTEFVSKDFSKAKVLEATTDGFTDFFNNI